MGQILHRDSLAVVFKSYKATEEYKKRGILKARTKPMMLWV